MSDSISLFGPCAPGWMDGYVFDRRKYCSNIYLPKYLQSLLIQRCIGIQIQIYHNKTIILYRLLHVITITHLHLNVFKMNELRLNYNITTYVHLN